MSYRVPRMVGLLALLALAACGSDESGGSAGGDDDGASPDTGVSPDAGAALDGSSAPDSVTPDVAPEPSRYGVQYLVDELAVELVRGRSEPITFEVPEGTVSVMVLVETETGVTVTLSEWTQENGDDLVPADWETRDQSFPSLCTVCANRVAGAESAFAAMAPNNETPEVVAGEHTIRIFGAQFDGANGQLVSTDAVVSVYANVLGEMPDTALLDLNLHFTGAGWTAEQAQADPEFQDILAEMNDLYNQVGISLGDITYRDIDTSFQIIEGVDGADNDLELLFRESASNDLDALNLFFVSEIRPGGPFGGVGLVLGIAGGIPGPALVQGTPRSGVAIAVDSHDNPQLPADLSLAKTMAHEAGHFLGLFHTSEQAFFPPQIHDPIQDTDENDSNYLMFNTGEGTVISEAQGDVMRINPWMRYEEVTP